VNSNYGSSSEGPSQSVGVQGKEGTKDKVLKRGGTYTVDTYNTYQDDKGRGRTADTAGHTFSRVKKNYLLKEEKGEITLRKERYCQKTTEEFLL